MLSNYRVTFGGENIDYKSNFAECRQQMSNIQKIILKLKEYDVENVWWFFEPYVEITWLSPNGEPLRAIKILLEELGIKYTISTPENGQIADWYCNSENEREFGAKSYAKSAELAMLFYEWDDSIEMGKGLENHYLRRCHVLANQLALNYKQEGTLLIKRGVLCLLFWFLGHRKAVWIYTKILRQKY